MTVPQVTQKSMVEKAILEAATKQADELFSCVQNVKEIERYSPIAKQLLEDHQKSRANEWYELSYKMKVLTTQWSNSFNKEITEDELNKRIRQVAICTFNRTEAINDLPKIVQRYTDQIPGLAKICQLVTPDFITALDKMDGDINSLKARYITILNAKMLAEASKKNLESLKNEIEPTYTALKCALEAEAVRHKGTKDNTYLQTYVTSSTPTVDRLRDELVKKEPGLKEAKVADLIIVEEQLVANN